MPTITIQNVLDQPKGENRLLDSLKRELSSSEYTSFNIIVAFAKIGPLRRLENSIKQWREEGKKVQAVIGLDENGTSYEALKFSLQNFDKTYVVHGKSSFRSTFHPKQYIFCGEVSTAVYIGSNNLTVGGTETNSESYIRLDLLQDDSDLKEQLLKQWGETLNIAKELDEDLLERLKLSGLVFEESVMRKARITALVTFAETEKDPEQRPDFPKIKTTAASRASIESQNSKSEVIDQTWQEYGNYLEESCKPNVNLYWNVGKKNNNLDQHLWAINFLIDNDAENNSGSDNDSLLKEAVKAKYPEQTMEGTRALFFSKLIGLIKKTSPFEVSEAYGALIRESSTSVRNSDVVSKQIEKFYFWNDIFSPVNRHLGPGGTTQVSKEFRLYPIFFIYQTLIELRAKGFEPLALTRFEIELLMSTAKTHADLGQGVSRIAKYRQAESPEDIEEYLNLKSREMDSRFFNVIQYVKYFDFDHELIVLKPEYYDEIKQKVLGFDNLLNSGKLIEYSEDTSSKYRDMLFSSLDLIAYHARI